MECGPRVTLTNRSCGCYGPPDASMRAVHRAPVVRSATPPDRSETEGSSSSSSPLSPGPRPGPRALLDPVAAVAWGGALPATRRALLGGLGGVAIALVGNLGGAGSWLLGLDGGRLAARLRADTLLPVRGAKRCVEAQLGFEFTYPASWLADQTLAARAAKRAEAQRGSPPGGSSPDDPDSDLDRDFPSLIEGRAPAGEQRRRQQRAAPAAAVAEPVVAFGPPGSTGEENVSVIVAPIAPGFTLRSLGDPRVAGERLLAALAPPGSGLTATLLGAQERSEAAAGAAADPAAPAYPASPAAPAATAGEQLYYTLEYSVQGPRFSRHNVSVYTTRDDLLYTFNAQSPEERWQQDAPLLQAAAASFRLML